ncbi:MAG TPA: ABC transporter permease subunit [Candidatus Limiplasma sp.]|nr:ABC transporter permease subunit [Candidatus Limiplasma sp.]HRX08005.1 ABC transporter permease subunit [Candidatus Limiplasma sp.]
MIGNNRMLRKQSFARDFKNNRVYLLLLIPAIVYVIIFNYIPMGGAVIAFKNYNYSAGIFGSAWVGLKNFRFLLISNKLWTLTRNTLAYNFAFIVIGMFLEVMFAVIINEMRSRWFKKTFQSFMFLPFFVSWVVAVSVIQTLLDYDNGLVTRIVESFGGNMTNIYTTAAPWPFLLVFFRMWKGVGYGTIIYLSAVTSIDQEMYEAADIDGANSWQKVFKVTIPNLVPTMIIMFLLAVGQIFRGDFGMFFQLVGNNGVLLETADILDLYVYRALSSGTNLGMSAAAGLYQSVLCFATIMTVNYIVKKIQPDYTLF